tara:strand:+ start:40 stop:807 length:768 start_codon:yes stop_codon:yes gene_type:complete
MKLLRVVFSTNRLEFLKKTFKASQKFNYEGLEVDHLFIDDYPKNRDDKSLEDFAKIYGFNEFIFHEKNKGITKTWQELFDLVKERDYDYILHHEDDVELKYPLKVMDMIRIFESNKSLSQIQLKRNNWYSHETEEIGKRDDDIIFENYRYELAQPTAPYFWMLMSLYPAWIAKEPILEETGHNPSEGVISYYLKQKYNLNAGLLKTLEGDYMVHHIGEYSQGKRVCEGEPGWDGFKYFDPNFKYCSKTGALINEN